jgi:hypothetical protein
VLHLAAILEDSAAAARLLAALGAHAPAEVAAVA